MNDIYEELQEVQKGINSYGNTKDYVENFLKKKNKNIAEIFIALGMTLLGLCLFNDVVVCVINNFQTVGLPKNDWYMNFNYNAISFMLIALGSGIQIYTKTYSRYLLHEYNKLIGRRDELERKVITPIKPHKYKGKGVEGKGRVADLWRVTTTFDNVYYVDINKEHKPLKGDLTGKTQDVYGYRGDVIKTLEEKVEKVIQVKKGTREYREYMEK